MAHMPTFKQPSPSVWQDQSSDYEDIQAAFRSHFTPFADSVEVYPKPSRVTLKDHGPDQRGFIIGGERL